MNEVAIVGGTYALATMTEDTLAMLHEELEGMGQVPFDIIKTPSGGGIMFEVPGDDPDQPDAAKELVGVIVAHHPMNAFWFDKYSGGNSQPDCSSPDGKEGYDARTGEIINCATCPRNQFAEDGSGKACKNMHRLYILRDGEILPVIFNVPPTGLRDLKDYLAKRVVLKGKRAAQVVTRVTLKKATNSGGISYSKPVFSKVGDLTPDQFAALKPTIDAVQAMTRAVPVYDEREADGGMEMTEVDAAPF